MSPTTTVLADDGAAASSQDAFNAVTDVLVVVLPALVALVVLFLLFSLLKDTMSGRFDFEARRRRKDLDARERHLAERETTAPAEPEPEPTPSLDEIRERFHTVETEYTTTETDPTVLIEAPVLRDTTADTTAAFHTAYHRAQEVIDTPGTDRFRWSGNKTATCEQIDAVTVLETAWRTAVDTAYRIGLDGLSQVDMRRARAAFHTAFDPAAAPAEARAARDRLVSYLDKVTTDDTGEHHVNGREVVDNHLAHAALNPSVRLALEPAPEHTSATQEGR